MVENTVLEFVKKANAGLTDPARNTIEGNDPNPRFELYHMTNSLCSHKVRTTLAAKNAGYAAHDMLFPTENYAPDYVRLRLKGGEQLTQVSSYTGRSSTTTEGFDPCVVPTLVDRDARCVVIDSEAICIYIDEVLAGPDLVPADINSEVLHQLDIVDGTPHVAILYGTHPGNDVRPKHLRERMAGIHAKKCDRLEKLIEEIKGDAALEEAYRNKIAKESAAAKFIASPANMQHALEEMAEIVKQLDADLTNNNSDWICGDRYTLADICWSVSLFRLKWLGLGTLWNDDEAVNFSAVDQYANRLFVEPCFRQAVIEYPGMPPSPYL